MAKYEFIIEITPNPDVDPEPPTLEEVRVGIFAGVQAAFPESEVKVNDGNRPDRD